MILGIFGAGATGKALVDVIERGEKGVSSYERKVFIDDECKEDICYGLEVFSSERLCREIDPSGFEFIVGLGNPLDRKVAADKLKRAGFRMGTYIEPTADVSPSAKIHEGAIVLSSFIDNQVVVESNAFINPRATIGHDTVIGEHSIVGVGAFVGGHSELEECVYFGPCAACKDRIHIGRAACVSINAAVFKDVPPESTAIGNPARSIMRTSPDLFK